MNEIEVRRLAWWRPTYDNSVDSCTRGEMTTERMKIGKFEFVVKMDGLQVIENKTETRF